MTDGQTYGGDVHDAALRAKLFGGAKLLVCLPDKIGSPRKARRVSKQSAPKRDYGIFESRGRTRVAEKNFLASARTTVHVILCRAISGGAAAPPDEWRNGGRLTAAALNLITRPRERFMPQRVTFYICSRR